MSGMWKRTGQAPREKLLVCLDLQRGSLEPGQAPDGCVVNCRRMLAHARMQGWQVVHVHSKKADPTDARPIEGLEPLVSEPVVYRTTGSAFSSRAFRELVAGLGACELVIVGYSVTASCLATALVAYDEELAVTMVEDAVCATSVNAETRDALAVLTRQMARPFLWLGSTESLVGAPRLLRVV
jgi:nicotinamidase-related amidase